MTSAWYVYMRNVLSRSDKNALICRGGATVEYRSEPIPRSEYHAKLDEDEADNAVDKAKEDIQVSEAGVRYWSDYSRVFFHRRTIQRLPDVPEWEDVEGDWVNGAETFEKYDEVSSSSCIVLLLFS